MNLFRRLDPRSKIFYVGVVSTVAVVFDSLIYLSILLVVSFAVLYLCGGSGIGTLYRLRKILYLLVGIAIVQSIFTSEGTPIITIGSIRILTDYGVFRGLQFLLRLSVIIVSSSILLTSTNRDLTQGLLQLKIPYEIVFMLLIAGKFLPLLRDEFNNKVIAMELSGVDFKKIGFKKKLTAYKYLLLPVTVNSLLKSKEMAISMEVRGFRAMDRRSSYRELKFEKIDLAFIISSMIFITVLFIIR